MSKALGTKKTQYHCDVCSYSTPRKGVFEDHLRVHTGERPFKCEICGKAFTQKSNLGQHLKVHDAGDQREFQCDTCDFTTKWRTSLLQHERWHRGEKPYKCTVCGRSFSQSTHRRSHMKEAHLDIRSYQCDICSKTFKRQDHLDRHILFHKNERIHECDVCHKKFVDDRYLLQHRMIHEGDATKRFECPFCPYRSRYKQGLDVHVRLHTGERPYQCHACPKTFTTSQSLRLHTRMLHQGMAGKIFKCDMCEFATANKQSLKHHVRRIHQGIREDVNAQCPYCPKIYMSRSSLHGHKQKKHPRQLKRELQKRRQKRLQMITSSAAKNKNLGSKKIRILGSISTGMYSKNESDDTKFMQDKSTVNQIAEKTSEHDFSKTDNNIKTNDDMEVNLKEEEQDHKDGMNTITNLNPISGELLVKKNRRGPRKVSRTAPKPAIKSKKIIEDKEKEVTKISKRIFRGGLKIKLKIPSRKKRVNSPISNSKSTKKPALKNMSSTKSPDKSVKSKMKPPPRGRCTPKRKPNKNNCMFGADVVFDQPEVVIDRGTEESFESSELELCILGSVSHAAHGRNGESAKLLHVSPNEHGGENYLYSAVPNKLSSTDNLLSDLTSRSTCNGKSPSKEYISLRALISDYVPRVSQRRYNADDVVELSGESSEEDCTEASVCPDSLADGDQVNNMNENGMMEKESLSQSRKDQEHNSCHVEISNQMENAQNVKVIEILPRTPEAMGKMCLKQEPPNYCEQSETNANYHSPDSMAGHTIPSHVRRMLHFDANNMDLNSDDVLAEENMLPYDGEEDTSIVKSETQDLEETAPLPSASDLRTAPTEGVVPMALLSHSEAVGLEQEITMEI